MGQITQTTSQLQTILDNTDASNVGKTSLSDASDTTAVSLKKSGFYSLAASSSNAPSTDRSVLMTAVRDTGATGEIRYGQVVWTESNGLWWNRDDGGSLGTWYEAVATAATQTLTNKTLTSPVLTTPQINDSAADHQYIFASANLAADRTVSLPLLTGNDTFVFEAHTQTLTNKSLTAPILTGSSSSAGSIIFKEDTDNGTNAVTLIGPASTADVTVTLPAATDTLVGKATTDTLTNKTLTSAVLNTGVSGSAVLDSDTMSGASATTLATSESIKAYVDAQVGSYDTLAEVLANGNTSGGNALQMTTTDELQFRDTALKIFSSADGQLDIDADTEVEITATTVHLNGNTDVTGSVTADGLTIDGGGSRQYINSGHLRLSDGYNLEWGGGTNYVRGSNASNYLLFATNGSEAARIDSSGNVGISTTAPGMLLDVDGSSGANDIARFSGPNSGGLTLRNATSNEFILHTATSDALIFGTNGNNERVRIAAAGEMQIGGTTNAGFIDFDGQNLQLNTQRNPNTGTFVNTGYSHAGLTLLGSSGGSSIKFYTAAANNTVGTQRAVIASNGNIGLGVTPVTDNLSSFLNVQVGQNGVIMGRQSNPSLSIADNVYRADAGSTGYKAITTAASSMISQSGGQMDFYTNASASAGADVTLGKKMTILPAEVRFNDDSNDYDFRVESNNNGSMFVVDGGSDAVLVGHSASTAVAGENHELQVYDTNFSVISGTTFRNGSDGATLSLGHSRSGTIGTQTILQDGDTMGQILFVGSDGSDFANTGAYIRANVDGTPGTDDMPGELLFATTADGANWPTDRMHIRSAGNTLIKSTGTGSIPTGILVQTADANTPLTLWNESNSATYSGLKLETRSTNASGWMIANEWQSNYNGDLLFRSRDGASSSSEIVRMKSNGRVGLGIDPSELLHVYHGSGNAAIRVSGEGNVNRKCQIEYNTTDGPIIRAGSSGIVSLKFAVDNTTLAGKFDTNADFYTNDGTVHSLSDIRVKTDVEHLVDGLDIVRQLKPRTYRYTEDSEFYNEDTKDEIRYGFVANEVEAVAPQYTDTGKGKIGGEEVDDLKSLSTTKMIPMLVKAIQEQQEQIEELKSEIATLKGE